MIAFRKFAPLILGALCVACEEDSTGPSVLDVFAAARFDALGHSRFGKGDTQGGVAARAAALALRTGVRPARVSITVDGATEQYWALEVERAFGDDVTESPVLQLPIVSRTMVAWRGSGPERVISITLEGDTGTFRWPIYRTTGGPYVYSPSVGLMFERGGPTFHAAEGGGRTTRPTIGAECELPRREPIMQVVAPILWPTCHAAVFLTRFNMRVVEEPVSGAVAVRARVVEMDAQDVPGIRLWSPQVPCIAC